MPPTPSRSLVEILRELAGKDVELGKLLFPAEGEIRRGFYPEGRLKLAGAPVLTGTTVADKASAAKLLQLSKDLPPAEAQKVRGLVSSLLANLEGRRAAVAGQGVELFPGQSNLGRQLGARNTLDPKQLLALVKETMSNPLYKGPSFEESMRMAGGNPLKLMLPPSVVLGAQRRAVIRTLLPVAREARLRGEALSIPSRASRQGMSDPSEVLKEIRQTAEGAGGSKGRRYEPVLPQKKEVAPSKLSSKTTKATLSDIFPGLQFESRGGKVYISWRGQEPVTIADAIKLTGDEPYTSTLLRGLASLEQKMRKLPTPTGREASEAFARKLRGAKRYVEDKTRPSGHVETSWDDIKAAREERQGSIENREALGRWRMSKADEARRLPPPQAKPPKAPSENQLALFFRKLGLGSEDLSPMQMRLQEELKKAASIGSSPSLVNLTANEVGKYLNRAIINEQMAKRGRIPLAADVRAGIGSKQRIAAHNQFAKMIEEAALQRAAEGRSLLAEALKKASKQERPRTAAATALLGMRGMKKLGIEDAQAQLIDALLSQPGGNRILQQLTQKAITRGVRERPYGKIKLVPQPKPEPRRAAVGRIPAGPTKKIKIARPAPPAPQRAPEVMQDYPRQQAQKASASLQKVMQKFKRRIHPLDWERFIIDL